MAISLTLFNSIYDNKTDKSMNLSDWQQFEKLLYDLSSIKKESKKDAQLISPATYQPNTTRANANVINWAGWAAVDVDDHVFEGNLKNELYARYGNLYYICYSTASSTDDHPKFRLVFPLKSSIRRDKIKKFWFALNTELGSIGDRQTKDLSRMYYIPAQYAGANNFIFTNSGVWIDPDALMDKHPLPEKQGSTFFERLPEEMQKTIIQHRKDQMENRSIKWTSYHDCPFINKNLIAEYKATSGTGWYHLMYRIMVSIAGNAVKREYPITVSEIVQLCKELDIETGQWYDNRPLDKEAERAIEFVYSNV
jgi:hypothetical protein